MMMLYMLCQTVLNFPVVAFYLGCLGNNESGRLRRVNSGRYDGGRFVGGVWRVD